MSTDKLDMSLEDIIRMNKPQNDGQRNVFHGSRGGRSGGRRGSGIRSREGSDNWNRNLGMSSGGIQKREKRSSAFTKQKDLPDQWKHDLFEDTDVSVGRHSYEDRRQGSDDKSGTLLISNLHYGVSDSDIKELFDEFGRLMKASVHYDRSGRSLGTAEVMFGNSADALQAMKQYNNVPLDGQPMKITLLNETSQNRSVASRIGPTHISSNNDFRQQRRQFSSGTRERQRSSFADGQRHRGGGRHNRSVPTREELDAELDAYNAKMETE